MLTATRFVVVERKVLKQCANAEADEAAGEADDEAKESHLQPMDDNDAMYGDERKQGDATWALTMLSPAMMSEAGVPLG